MVIYAGIGSMFLCCCGTLVGMYRGPLTYNTCTVTYLYIYIFWFIQIHIHIYSYIYIYLYLYHLYIYLQSIPWAVGFLHTSAVPTVLYSYMICWFWQDSESQNLVTWSNYESLCLFFIYRHVLINVHLHVHHVFKHYICHETFFYTETTGSLGP